MLYKENPLKWWVFPVYGCKTIQPDIMYMEVVHCGQDYEFTSQNRNPKHSFMQTEKYAQSICV